MCCLKMIPNKKKRSKAVSFVWPKCLYCCNIHVVMWKKMPTRCNRWYLLQILLHAQHVSGNTMPIIRSSRVLYRWLLPVVFGTSVFRLSVWCGAEGYVSVLQATAVNLKTEVPNTSGNNQQYNTLELLTMGIVLPETCWACNKICSKYHLLHLVGILFPHNKYDARSKSLQIQVVIGSKNAKFVKVF